MKPLHEKKISELAYEILGKRHFDGFEGKYNVIEQEALKQWAISIVKSLQRDIDKVKEVEFILQFKAVQKFLIDRFELKEEDLEEK